MSANFLIVRAVPRLPRRKRSAVIGARVLNNARDDARILMSAKAGVWLVLGPWGGIHERSITNFRTVLGTVFDSKTFVEFV